LRLCHEWHLRGFLQNKLRNVSFDSCQNVLELYRSCPFICWHFFSKFPGKFLRNTNVILFAAFFVPY
jgi:hypothetical protein